MTMPAPLDPSTEEERALAQRLARLGPHGEPSPQLDARVLAAARGALDTPLRSTRRSHRWPVALGVAASLVLAVGVAWRLRPLPPGSAADLAAPTRPIAQTGPASQAYHAAAATAVEQALPEPPPDASKAEEAAAARQPEPLQAVPRRAARIATPRREPDVQTDTSVPAPVTIEAPAPPPPPAKAAQDSLAGEQAASAAATAQNNADAVDRAATPTQAEASDEPLDAMPPATADAPGVRDAWLSRIRALIDSGDVAGGRRSLRAFAERYPDYPLPEDLRALLR